MPLRPSSAIGGRTRSSMSFLHGLVLARTGSAASRIMWSWPSRFKQLVRRDGIAAPQSAGVASVGRPRDVPVRGCSGTIGVARGLVGLRRVERAVAIGPHPAAVVADDHREIAV